MRFYTLLTLAKGMANSCFVRAHQWVLQVTHFFQEETHSSFMSKNVSLILLNVRICGPSFLTDSFAEYFYSFKTFHEV